MSHLSMTAVATHIAPSMAIAVLFAGVLHALWNLLAKMIEDRIMAFAVIGTAMAAGGAVMLIWGGMPATNTLALCAASITIHVIYQFGLIASYRLGSFNQVYPLARGSAPLLVALASFLLLGEKLTALALLGIVLLSLGLAGLAFSSGRLVAEELPAIVVALLTGCAIASYTVLDGIAVRRSGSVLGYAGLLFLGLGPIFPIYALFTRPRELWRHKQTLYFGLGAGVISLLAYGVVLFAQTRAPLAEVAALRESAIISGAILGTVVLNERFGGPRVFSAVIAVTGIAIVAGA